MLPFEKSFASHPKSHFWSKKNNILPHEVSYCTGIKYWFDCDKCTHDFMQNMSAITGSRARWCAYCTNQKLCDNINCIECYNKSFASHEKSQFWSDDNNKVVPRDVFKSSKKEYLFNCDICNHEFPSSTDKITKNHWCGYCANKLLCDDENCVTCFDKSFASHEKAQFWSKENKVLSREIFKNTHPYFLFDCDKCNHQFKQSPHKINCAENWCGYCSVTSTLLCDDIECDFCYNKSFASHPKAKYWSNENLVDARSVRKHSDKEFDFFCKAGHVFKMGLNKATYSWCPRCVNKTEDMLCEFIKSKYLNAKKCFKVNWCKRQTHLPFDIVIPEFKIIIELDGVQHFKQVSKWKSPEFIQSVDIYKMNCAIEKGYSIIRLLQEDVYYKRYDWKYELLNTIEKIKQLKQVGIVYMCKKNEYDVYKQNITSKGQIIIF